MTEIRVGCSGWHYKYWVGPFYPEGTRPSEMLPYYLRYFDTVEINNSFYRLPERATFEAWRKATPPNFQFAVKASRFITHMKKLKDPHQSIARFFESVAGLEEKLGIILFQLPPAWKLNYERLEEFLGALPAGYRYTVEFRELSWMNDRVLDLLKKHNVAFCIYQLAGYMSPLEITADFTYVRLHGPTGYKYQGSYSDEALEQWASQIRRWSRSLRGIYFYFDNDDSGYAAHNAITLRRMLRPAQARAVADEVAPRPS